MDKIYPKGIRTFKKNENAPDFVLGKMIIAPNEFVKWVKENQHLMTEYNGEKQIKFDILKGRNDVYFTVDTYKKQNESIKNEETDDLHF